MDYDDIVAATRFTAWALMLAKTLIVANVYFKCDLSRPIRDQLAWFDERRSTILLGFVLTSFGWTLHQFYWWLAEIAGAAGRGDIRNIFLHWSIITVAFYAVIFIGVVLILSGWLHQYAGRYWPAAGAAIIAALLIVGAICA